MNPDVSIVIPNFNGARLLQSNLPSVLDTAATYAGDASIIVVDDGSSDDSVAVMREQFPQIRLVAHKQNKGFSEAVYSGIDAAQTDLIFLLNSDVQPDKSVIQPLVDYFNKAETFAVGPLIRNEHGKINRHSWNIRAFHCGNLKPIQWNLEEALAKRQRGWLPAIYASGGSMMLRKSMFMALDGFHPMYKPFYGEDYDLGLRAWRRGWRSYFEPTVSVTHQRIGSSIKSNTKRDYVRRIRRRNRLLLEWTHFPIGRLWGSVIPLSIWQLLGELVLLDRVNVMGYLEALHKIPAVLKARRKLAMTQELSLSQILVQVAGNHSGDL